MEVKEIQERTVPILKRRAVKRASVFGSSARGDVAAHDVDMLVEVSRPYGLFSFISLKQELEDALGTKVDLVEYDALKSQLRERVLREAVPIL